MDKTYYTPDHKHPEDEIARVKTFINELQSVQEKYYEKLVCDLNLTEKGESLLFDYIYNEQDPKLFEEYLAEFNNGHSYEELVKTPDKKKKK